MSNTNTERPRVGVGVIIENAEGKILVLRRIGSHAQKYSIPGGSIELGETFEATAIREMEEELGIVLKAPKVIAVTNNLETYKEDGVHFVSVIMVAKEYAGEPTNMEPTKHAELLWCDPKALPEPHFDASRLGVQCYLIGSVYEGIY